MRRQVVLLVENGSVPRDPRVWNEARILKDAGYDVTVVCPITETDPEPEIEIDGINVRRFKVKMAEDGVVDFVVEYATALVKMAWITWRLKGPIDVIHSANPPDFLFLIGLLPKLRWRTKLLFDHHDLMPELFESRFGRGGLAVKALRAIERLNFRFADAVVSTNESYRNIAIERGGRRPEQVRVVRNTRDTSVFTRVPADPALKRGKQHLAVYVGMMGPQDGVDTAVRIAAHYRNDLGRDDLHICLVGDGPIVPEAKALAERLGVGDVVEFVGWQETDEVLRYLSTADVGLATDPPNPLNDRSTMIKVIEYLTIGLPVVSFDLSESVVSAGDAALYVTGGDELAYARELARLLDDPALRQELSDRGIARSRGELSWATSRDQLLATYHGLTGTS